MGSVRDRAKRQKRAAAAWEKVKNLPRNRGTEHFPVIDGKPLSDNELETKSKEIPSSRGTSDRSTQRNRFKKDLRSLDPNSPEYWNEVLRRKGLTPLAGDDKQRVLYVGTSVDLEG